ncbi:MAG: phage integrase N-terminal SAM-like domain-containing protein [Anaerolineales bacterium]|nr:phage integrase N-terminal SAM-like domain-containing protein [Anaerolineales bacterium]
MTEKPKLLDQMRHVLRLKHYSYKTEKAYVHWARRFIFYHNKRHPAEMGKQEVEVFWVFLAEHVAASTHKPSRKLTTFKPDIKTSKQLPGRWL